MGDSFISRLLPLRFGWLSRTRRCIHLSYMCLFLVQPISPLIQMFFSVSGQASAPSVNVVLIEEKVSDCNLTGFNYYLDKLPDGYQVMDYPNFQDENMVGTTRASGHLGLSLTMNSDTNASSATRAVDTITPRSSSSHISCG
jgi:hypothetical protein